MLLLEKMVQMPVDGQTKNIISFSRLFNYMEKTGTKFTSMWEQEQVLKLVHMHKNTSTNSGKKPLNSPTMI